MTQLSEKLLLAKRRALQTAFVKSPAKALKAGQSASGEPIIIKTPPPKRGAQQIAAKKSPQKADPAVLMALAYEAVLGDYLLKPYMRLKKTSFDPNRKAYRYFKKAAAIADDLKVSYDEYCRAQFYWIHRIAGRSAMPSELCVTKSDFPAKKRTREYIRLVNENYISPKVETPVLQVAKDLTVDELDIANRAILKELTVAWGLTEEECFERFGLSGLFDLNWLKKQSTFRKLRAKGRL